MRKTLGKRKWCKSHEAKRKNRDSKRIKYSYKMTKIAKELNRRPRSRDLEPSC